MLELCAALSEGETQVGQGQDRQQRQSLERGFTMLPVITGIGDQQHQPGDHHDHLAGAVTVECQRAGDQRGVKGFGMIAAVAEVEVEKGGVERGHQGGLESRAGMQEPGRDGCQQRRTEPPDTALEGLFKREAEADCGHQSKQHGGTTGDSNLLAKNQGGDHLGIDR